MLFFKNNRTYRQITVGTQNLRVEVVSTPSRLSQGLSGRTEIGSDGMLFILPIRDVPRFWMKGMKFGLDIVWIDSERVVAITAQVPPAGDRTSPLQIYSPDVPATHVLELPFGDAKQRGIRIGDSVRL